MKLEAIARGEDLPGLIADSQGVGEDAIKGGDVGQFGDIAHETPAAATLRGAAAAGLFRVQANLPWQCLYLRPEPQGQGSLRPTRPQVVGSFGSRSIAS